jgi:hypothetical protein
MPGPSAAEGINSTTNIAKSLSSIDLLDKDPSTRNDAEKLGDNISGLATGVGAFIPGLGPVIAVVGAAVSFIGGLSG